MNLTKTIKQCNTTALHISVDFDPSTKEVEQVTAVELWRAHSFAGNLLPFLDQFDVLNFIVDQIDWEEIYQDQKFEHE